MYVPVPQKLISFRKIPRSKNALFVNVRVAKSIFTGQIYFHWSNVFSLVESILWHIWCTSQCHKNWLFTKNPSLKTGLVCQCGSSRIFFHWSNLLSLAKKAFVCQCGKTSQYNQHNVGVPFNKSSNKALIELKRFLIIRQEGNVLRLCCAIGCSGNNSQAWVAD